MSGFAKELAQARDALQARLPHAVRLASKSLDDQLNSTSSELACYVCGAFL
jgi:hypothetical protein